LGKIKGVKNYMNSTLCLKPFKPSPKGFKWFFRRFNHKLQTCSLPDYETKFKVGKTYKVKGTPKYCDNGFHYYESLADCLDAGYSFNSRFCIVEPLGDVVKGSRVRNEVTCVTNELKIVKELSLAELLSLVDVKQCTLAKGTLLHCAVVGKQYNLAKMLLTLPMFDKQANNIYDCNALTQARLLEYSKFVDLLKKQGLKWQEIKAVIDVKTQLRAQGKLELKTKH
jgi:hypothetical protein